MTRKGGKQTRLPRDDEAHLVAEIVERYKAGDIKIRQLASEYPYSVKTTMEILASHGVPMRTSKFLPLTEAEERIIAQRYAAGDTFEILCKEFGRNKIAIKIALAKYDVPVRRRGYQTGTVWHDEWRKAHLHSTTTDEFRGNFKTMLAMMVKSVKDSPIERLLQDELRKAGICFIPHTKFRQPRGKFYYEVDIEICQAPVIIEADGRLHKMGQRIERDKERDHFITSQHGYRIFRFAGSKIFQDAGECIRHVIAECDLQPDVCQIKL